MTGRYPLTIRRLRVKERFNIVRRCIERCYTTVKSFGILPRVSQTIDRIPIHDLSTTAQVPSEEHRHSLRVVNVLAMPLVQFWTEVRTWTLKNCGWLLLVMWTCRSCAREMVSAAHCYPYHFGQVTVYTCTCHRVLTYTVSLLQPLWLGPTMLIFGTTATTRKAIWR
jgi:hypothetical protein